MSAEEAEVVDNERFTPLDDYHFLGNSYTVERKRAFLESYREEGSIYHAAQITRVSRKTVYNWMEQDAEFAEALTDSKEDTYDKLETSVYKRAFSDNLLAMFYLKAHRPKFRDKVMVDVSEVQEQIDRMMAKLDSAQRQQLPAAVTEFIDTDYSQQANEYQSVSDESQPSQPQQFSSPSQSDQKEESD
jgi:hypothetical protein